MIIEKDIENIKVGMYIVGITYPKNTFNLAQMGWLESEKALQYLKQKGILKLNIDTEKTKDFSQSSSINPNPQKPVQSLYKDKLVTAKRVFDKSKEIQKQLFHDAKNGSPLNLEPVKKITDESLALIFDNPDALACVLNIRHTDEYLLEHSVAVSVLMTIFSFDLKLDKEVVKELAIGAFLHDVGKIMVPEAILNKPGKLTDAEFEIMKTHASHSIRIIEQTPNIGPLSLAVASLHHEKLNGKGYPKGLIAEKISLYGRMITICDIFDALTANRCYKAGYSQVKAFHILRTLAQKGELDAGLVDRFIKCMGVYPVGALVQLESNRLAIVESHNVDDPIHPKVKPFYILDPMHFEVGSDIDLADQSDDLIVKCVRADDFDLDMDQIIEYLSHEG